MASVNTATSAPTTTAGSSNPFVPTAGQGLVSSSTGLVSGLQTQQIINALLTFDQEPVTDLNNKITAEQNQQNAFSTLSSQLATLQADAQQLSSPSVLGSRSATSSNPSAIAASASPSAPLASYLVTPIAQAQTQELLSNGFSDTTSAPVGQGTITVKLGGFVQPSTSLAQLNGGAGVARGKISITDRSGASATVDLSAARTIDDVVNDINQTAGIHVQASISGNSLVLTDKSGSSSSNLLVQDVANGTTAANLGIAGSVAANTLTGTSLVSLSASTQLSSLNDGNGVATAGSIPDFTITAKNGSSFSIQLGSATTLQDVLNAINNDSQNAGKVTASISGTHLVLTDNTGGSGTLSVSALNGSTAAKDLGILGTEQGGGVLTGSQIISGLDTVLLKDLNGGSGITTPGKIQLTDRSGATATVDLTGASTLNDVISAINGAGLGLVASVNAAGDGIQINDTTGRTTSNLIVADAGGGTTAANLHLTANTATNSVNSGDLNLQYISANTALSQLNGGAGIQSGSFQITDSNGRSATVSLTGTSINTVGQLINAINTSGVGVRASINTTGDGILLTDIGGGSGNLQVTDQGGTTAASLKLAGTAVGGQIDGAFRYNISVGPNDTLTTLQQELLDSGAPVTSNILNDGSSSQPYHILIGSTQSGVAGRLLVDPGTTGLSLSTLTPASDAVIQVGSGSGNSLLFTSSTNTFTNILPGLTVNVTGTSSTPVSVTVGQDSSALVNAIQTFVSDFNTVSSTISQDDAYNTSTNTGSVLYADPTIEQISNTLMNAITGYGGTSTDKTRSLLQMGVTLKNGQLSVDTTALQAAIAADPSGVQDFLGNATTGMATKLSTALQNISAPYIGLIGQQVQNLTQQISDQQSTITFLNAQIAAKTTLLQNQFANMETALASLQSQGNVLSQLANLATVNAGYAAGTTSGGSSSKSG
ncbi:MAG TPA: flagellar filament capping protein FliD [Pirellulales bacterium]|nr:flagellar filament capping protein FliD [Pirellulales bacterium]